MTVHQTLRFSLRSCLAATLLLCLYLALAQQYGYGRAVLCVFTVFCGTFAIVFVLAARECYREASLRAAAATTFLALLILAGALIAGIVVFSRPYL